MSLAIDFLPQLLAGLAFAGAVVWLITRNASSRSVRNAECRQVAGLTIVDVAMVDSRRSLVLIRRDSTEHLLLIGGPNDIVIESSIARLTLSGESRPSEVQRLSEATPLPNVFYWDDVAAIGSESEPASSALQSGKTELHGQSRAVAESGAADPQVSDGLASLAQEPMVHSKPPGSGHEPLTDHSAAGARTSHTPIAQFRCISSDIAVPPSQSKDQIPPVSLDDAVLDELESGIIKLVKRLSAMR